MSIGCNGMHAMCICTLLLGHIGGNKTDYIAQQGEPRGIQLEGTEAASVVHVPPNVLL